jgi:hydrogenase nickel incorporation protein HypB
MESVTVMAQINEQIDRVAAENNRKFSAAGILAANVIGAPGTGKTSVISALISELPEWRHWVIEGDIESDIDTRKLRELGVQTQQINTHGACHLDPEMIAATVAGMSLEGPGLLLIENIGNLVCPAELSIGEHLKIVVVAVTDGSDKPYKYPLAFEKADLILLNKIDLLPYVDFDQEYFMAGVRALNPNVPVMPVNAKGKVGLAAVAAFLRERARG